MSISESVLMSESEEVMYVSVSDSKDDGWGTLDGLPFMR